MRISKLALILLCVLVLVAFFATSSFASKADELLAQGRAALAKASQPHVSKLDRDEQFKRALDKFHQVASDSSYANSVQAVQASYEEGQVHELIAATKPANNYNDLQQAYQVYKGLLDKYDRTPDELSQTFERGEIKQVLDVVTLAKARKTALAEELDKQNSKKPLYKVMDFFVSLTGRIPSVSYWLAIILVTLIVKLLITPLTKAQFKAMKEMQKVAPLIKEIQEKYKGDQKTIGEKTMEIYKEHGINPFASCLPLLVQMPILWLLYSMIRTYEFQFVHGKFLWIGAMAHPIPIKVPIGAAGYVWFTARNLSEPDLILVVLYLISMYISTRLSAVDPSQAEQQKMMAIVMPIMFAFIFVGFPSAFLLYWLVFNILQTAQQYLILRGGPTPDVVPAGGAPSQEPNAPTGDTASRRVRRRRNR